MPDRITWIQSTQDKCWRAMNGATATNGECNLKLSSLRHQTWHGFGGCFNEIGWDALSKVAPDQKKKAIEALFDPKSGCRLNFGRLPIGASDYALDWYSCNETPGDYAMKHFTIDRDGKYLIPFIKSAMELCPDIRLFASPWSPPTWMKSPSAYNYGKLVWEKKNLQAYAQYFVKFVQAYAKQGMTIQQIHVQNEPSADQKFPSCLWTGVELRDFIRDHMGPAFEKAGLDAEIWLGTINSDDYNGYANTVLSDPAARKYIRGVGYQWGGKWAIHRTITSHPQVPLMQTENECGDGKNTWDYAHYIFDLFSHYIIHDVRAYIYWNMVLPPGGRSTWGWNQNSMIVADPESRKIRFMPEFYVMKHFSAFIDPGAVRLGLMGPWAGNAVCFANPDGAMSLVIANPFADTRTLSFQGPKGVLKCNLAPRSFNTIRQML